ncbi:hypothetical protein B0H21DRAFT_480817 [Amylocystis lapponica]|nr:hypothetical protein B0H21DRAFT_480817 [Amylocystis lapponica]
MMEIQLANSVIPERRRRPAEVIDVDALDDDDDVRFVGFRSVRRRLSENPERAAGSSSNAAAIIITDSDDEQDVPSRSSGEPSVTGFRFISPPPPPVQPRIIPPVPPIPRHLAGHGSFPAHLRDAPIIRPINEPFPFEAHIRAPLHHAPVAGRSSPGPVPAPRSHHQPVMGLGGGLIALNRQRELTEANRRRADAERRLPEGLRPWNDILRRFTRAAADYIPHFGPWDDDDILDALEPSWTEHQYEPPQPSRWRAASARAGRSGPQCWRPAYTHPGKPASGFTFDFAPEEGTATGSSSPIIVLDDDAGPSTSTSKSAAVEVTSTLVCARCLEPLVLSAGGSEVSEEEIAKKRVWALRCGHMLDGKCMDELMRPSPPSPMPSALELLPEDEREKGRREQTLKWILSW